MLAAAACAVFVSLGNWQSRRAEEKKAIAAELGQAMSTPALELSAAAPAAGYVHKHVAARGSFEPRQTVYLDNKLRRGRPGYEVITPLRLAGSDVYVLVNRGWVAAPARREEVPAIATPPGEIRIEGFALERLPHALEAGAAPQGKVRQNVDADAFAAETGLRLLPLVIEQHSPAGDGLLREWAPPDAGADKNESYALQWYSFAGLSLALGAFFAFRREPQA